MPKLFSKSGGVSIKIEKSAAELETVAMPVPDKVTIPMLQHMGRPCEPTVKLTDLVKVGQVIGDTDAYIGAPIHSSVSGKVTAVEDYIAPNGAISKAVVIETDKLQELDESIAPPKVETREDLVAAIRASGLVGLGGAGFPTSVKLAPPNLDEIDSLVVNGAECEPYIVADYRAMLEETEDLLEGIRIVQKYLGIKQVIIGIESNKPKAIQKLEGLTKDDSSIKVQTLAHMYPQGSEKVLINETLGRVVPEGKLPSDVNCVVLNVSTCIFISRYLKTGVPLITKRLTIDGDAVAKPMNVLAPIGASFADVLEFAGGFKGEPKKIIMGGPMMGMAIYDTAFPVLKHNNAILAFSDEASKEKPETNCIRCGRCVYACPVKLMPAAIEKAYKADNVDSLKELKVNLCIECGCCAYVCPAKRKLVAANRLAKKLVAASENN